MNGCRITEDQMSMLCRVLSTNNTITDLSISTDTKSKNYSVGRHIARLLTGNTSLIKLDISGCPLGYRFYYSTYKSSLVDETAFGDALAKTSTLSELTLDIVSADMLKLISSVISRNSKVNIIKMEITDKYL